MPALARKKHPLKNLVTASRQEKEFAEAFFGLLPPEELEGMTAETLARVAASMRSFVLHRKPGEHKVRVTTPEPPKGEEAQPPSTVIEIAGDDMAFIVDSVSAELAHRGLRMETLLHPVVSVRRDSRHRLERIEASYAGREAGKPRPAGHLPESLIYIRLEQALAANACADLAERLRDVLQDVRAATSDWRPMLKKMDAVTASMPAARGGSDAQEGREFLSYLRANNFTFLGYREYRFAVGKTKAVTGSSLGLLKRLRDLPFISRHEHVLKKFHSPVMVGKLIDHYSPVHRRVPMDAISVKITDARGRLVGAHLFVGLFTSSTYSCRTEEVPIVRQKVRQVITRSGFRHGAHDYKALEHILEKMPRDELFQMTAHDIHVHALGILRLQEKHRIALFTHTDPLERYRSCLVYVPRDRYNTKFRQQAGAILEAALGGEVTNYFTTLDDSPLARALFTIRLPEGKRAHFDAGATEQKLIELGREWDEKLLHVLTAGFGRKKGTELTALYGRAFTAAYHEATEVENAVYDIRQLEMLAHGRDSIHVDLYRPHNTPKGHLRLKVYHRGAPVSLSDILPLLENMGLQALSEMPYEARPAGREPVWIHDFHLKTLGQVSPDRIKKNFEEAFLQVWHGRIENDAMNGLVILAGLTWREAEVFRAYGGFMRQARFPYTRFYMAQVLGQYPQITRAIIDLFAALHDPRGKKGRRRATRLGAAIEGMLQKVETLDHDRVLRVFRMLVERTLRTNYFQQDTACLSFKFDSRNIEGLPPPRPYAEIFVYSPRFEAVHLRGGPVARGGIRWSDRPDDFRTEILGLMKAQMVKNTVIVPTGAKGGFVLKRPPKEPAAHREEGRACYEIFVSALLDLTDNSVKGKIVKPRDIICHDGPDPYIVVAADKGTAKFSDTANAVSLKAGFWMGDAFASGGSAGYDHKEIGITARGGWESVKRHFREMGRDIQAEPFTVTGVGDMSGDVFGNAMLLSDRIRLVGAFNHVHIFCDPDPDPAASFAERRRLFRAGGGWDAYDRKKLSAGGAVFERSAKTLKLSLQIRKRFGITPEQVTPDELARAVLKAETDLLWFGGIGTFVKAAAESHADADDKTNDALRVDAEDVKAKVIGEGANLGVTQSARVAYARKGGRINTDFIDNSGGVDCSDHEVNIKILLNDVMAGKKLSLKERNHLLERMTEEVAELVLSDNYQQNQSLSLQALMARESLGLHADLIRALEKAGLIKRKLEHLPDEETLADLARDGQGLTRPELCVLTSWAKIALFREFTASDIPDDPALRGFLFDYFPVPLRKYRAEILRHRLRREIIGMQAVNTLVNRMGPVFVQSRVEKTGANVPAVVRAFLIAAEVFSLPRLWREIEGLDDKVPGAVQVAALRETYMACKRSVTWLLSFPSSAGDIGAEIKALGPGIAFLKKNIRKLLLPGTAAALQEEEDRLCGLGLPQGIAREIAVLRLLSSAGDIVSIARKTGKPVPAVATAYFLAGERLHIDWLKTTAVALKPLTSWQGRVIGALVDEGYACQAAVAAAIVRSPRGGEAWLASHAQDIARLESLIAGIRAQPKTDLDMLVLAGQRLEQFVDRL